MTQASRPHDETVVELLRDDPGFADDYLAESLAAIDEPGGQEAFLQALRHIAEAQGMAAIAERGVVQSARMAGECTGAAPG